MLRAWLDLFPPFFLLSHSPLHPPSLSPSLPPFLSPPLPSQDCVYRIKESFNREFDEVFRLKQAEIARIQERNIRIRNIISQLKFDDAIVQPGLDTDEQPERLLTVEVDINSCRTVLVKLLLFQYGLVPKDVVVFQWMMWKCLELLFMLS